jgi:hypothetical protein
VLFSKENRFWNAQSDPKFGQQEGGVNYVDARKKSFWNTIPACALLRKNFRNGVLVCSNTKIPLILSRFTLTNILPYVSD